MSTAASQRARSTPHGALERLGLAWAHPVHGAQQAFRVLLDAMAHPGRTLALPPAATEGVQAPCTRDGHAMSLAASVSLLTLLDAESSVHFAGPYDRAALAAYFRFHSGVPEAGAAQAAFTYAPGSAAAEALCRTLPQGSDAVPQDGATLVLDVADLAAGAQPGDGQVLRLRGPGIATQTLLTVRGSQPALWRWRAAQHGAFPVGIDLLLCCGDRVAAVPRSTLLALEATPCT